MEEEGVSRFTVGVEHEQWISGVCPQHQPLWGHCHINHTTRVSGSTSTYWVCYNMVYTLLDSHVAASSVQVSTPYNPDH